MYHWRGPLMREMRLRMRVTGRGAYATRSETTGHINVHHMLLVSVNDTSIKLQTFLNVVLIIEFVENLNLNKIC